MEQALLGAVELTIISALVIAIVMSIHKGKELWNK